MIICVSSSEPSRAAALASIFHHLRMKNRSTAVLVFELNYLNYCGQYRAIERDGVRLRVITVPKYLSIFLSLIVIRSGLLNMFDIDFFAPTSSWSRFLGSKVGKNYYFYGDGFGYANSMRKPSWLSHGLQEKRTFENIYFIKSMRKHQRELLDNGCQLIPLSFKHAVSVFSEISSSKKQEILFKEITERMNSGKNILIFCGTTFASSGRMRAENEILLYKRAIELIRLKRGVPSENVIVLLHPGNRLVRSWVSNLMDEYFIVNGSDPIYLETLLDYLLNVRNFPHEQCIICPGSVGPLLSALEYLKPKNILIPFSEPLLLEYAFKSSFLQSRLMQEDDMFAELASERSRFSQF